MRARVCVCTHARDELATGMKTVWQGNWERITGLGRMKGGEVETAGVKGRFV